jgi:hypothetical protein
MIVPKIIDFHFKYVKGLQGLQGLLVQQYEYLLVESLGITSARMFLLSLPLDTGKES